MFFQCFLQKKKLKTIFIYAPNLGAYEKHQLHPFSGTLFKKMFPFCILFIKSARQCLKETEEKTSMMRLMRIFTCSINKQTKTKWNI